MEADGERERERRAGPEKWLGGDGAARRSLGPQPVGKVAGCLGAGGMVFDVMG